MHLGLNWMGKAHGRKTAVGKVYLRKARLLKTRNTQINIFTTCKKFFFANFKHSMFIQNMKIFLDN